VRVGPLPSDETGTDRSASRKGGVESGVMKDAWIKELEEPLRDKDARIRESEEQLRDLTEKRRQQGDIIVEQGERLSERERRLGLT